LITTLFILSFIFCLAIAAAVFLLGYRLITTYSNPFLKSYFYYLISFYAFAFYGLWAQILVRYGLSQITVDETNLGLLANFLPLLGIPFLFVSWIMLIKMSVQVAHRSAGLKKEIITHAMLGVTGIVLLFTVYKLIPLEYLFLENEIPVSSLGILFALELIYFILYVIEVKGVSSSGRDLKNFNLLMLAGFFTRVVLFGLSLQFEFLLPLTVTLYFLTNLPPLFHVWQVSDNLFDPIRSETIESNLILSIAKRYGITKREQEIIEQISLGKTNQQIADDLFISLQTVKDHTHRIYKKTGVNSRMKLITLLSI
jgi:DNA-binding CsgD family transcriptional regulator